MAAPWAILGQPIRAAAQAGDPLTVELQTEVCIGRGEDERIRRLIVAELRDDQTGRIVPSAEQAASTEENDFAQLRVSVRCAEDWADIQVEGEVARSHLTRRVELSGTSSFATERIVALAAAALVRAAAEQWAIERHVPESHSNTVDIHERTRVGREEPDTSAQALNAPRSSQASVAGTRSSEAWELGVSAFTRVFLRAESTWSTGGRVYAGYGLLRVGASFGIGSNRDEFGEAQHRSLILDGTVRLLELAPLPGRIRVGFYVRGEIGTVSFQGSSGENITWDADDILGGAGALSSLRIRVAHTLALELGVGIGLMIGPSNSDDSRGLGCMSGAFAHLNLGLSRWSPQTP